jgi:hypothetical protein
MNTILIITSLLTILIGFAHSILGEIFILKRLFRRSDLPQLLGSDWFTKRTLRFAWHLTTIAWWGYAGIILSFMVSDSISARTIVLMICSAVFLISSIITGTFTRGKHVAWVVFLIISICTFYGAFAA